MESVSRKLCKNGGWWKLLSAGMVGTALTLAGVQILALPARAQSGNQSAPADAQKPAQSQDIPDAPSVVQPPTAPPPERLDKPPANPPDTDKSGNPSSSQPPARAQKPDDFGHAGAEPQPPPHMPPVETVPPGSNAAVSKAQPSTKADLLTFMVHVNSV